MTLPKGIRRGVPAISILGLLLGGVFAGAAASGVRVHRPQKSVCLGSPIKVGVRYRGSASQRGFRIVISDPAGKKVWAKKGRAPKKWRYWGYVTKRAGTHKIVYRTPRGRRNFRTNAVGCETPAPTLTPTPTPWCPAGEVCLADNDAGTALFSMGNMAPGSSEASCIKVSYTGTQPAGIRLYGSTTGTGLDQYLKLKVTRGKYDPPPEPAFDSCTNFVADSTNYVGAGPGVLYDGTLQGYPDDPPGYSGGLADPADCAAPPCPAEQWTFLPESHVYKFEVTLPSDASNAVQGLTAGQTFVWEARDS
jgi:hypothetical protein